MPNSLLNQTYYPTGYRKSDVEKIVKRLLSCQPISIIGLPRVGLARILRFILTHPELLSTKTKLEKVLLIEIDLNDIFSTDEKGFWQLVLKRISDKGEEKDWGQLVKNVYVSAAEVNDSFTFFDNIKQSLEKVCSEGISIFFLFNRFDRALPFFSYRFFGHLQSLKDVAKTRINFLFTSNRPLEYLFPEIFKGGNLEVFSQKYFLKPSLKEDLAGSVIKEFEKSRKIKLNQKVKAITYQYSGGHAQYALLILQALEKASFKTKDADFFLKSDGDILEQSKEIWDYLKQEEKALLLSRDKIPSDHLLVQVGLIDAKGEIFSPLFAHFLQIQKEVEEHSGQELTKKEKALLTILQSRQGELVTREDTINFVWSGKPEEVNEWTLDQLVKRLRRKISLLALPYHIKTLKNQGYKIIKL